MVDQWKVWGHSLKRDVFALWSAARDSCVPWHASALRAVVAAFALSPIERISVCAVKGLL